MRLSSGGQNQFIISNQLTQPLPQKFIPHAYLGKREWLTTYARGMVSPWHSLHLFEVDAALHLGGKSMATLHLPYNPPPDLGDSETLTFTI